MISSSSFQSLSSLFCQHIQQLREAAVYRGFRYREPVWPSGKAVMLVSRRASVLFRFGSPFSSKGFVGCGHCLVSLSLAINETLKRLSSLPILMQESFCGDSVYSVGI